MTEESNIREPGEEPVAEESTGPVAGERLAMARREQQISLDEVAKELHIDGPKVRALERNEFEVLGAPVFAKGHLRKYAQLVGISVDEALAEFDALNSESGEPPVVGKPRRSPREITPAPWIAVILIVAGAAGYTWYVYGSQISAPTPASTTVTPPVSIQEETESPGIARVDDIAEAAPESENVSDDGDTSESAAVDTQLPSAASPEPIAAAGQSTLRLIYSEDCWTEITDADEQRLFFDLGRSGETVNLVGRAPFRVVFGNAGAVDITLDGEVFEIPATARTGRTARFSISR